MEEESETLYAYSCISRISRERESAKGCRARADGSANSALLAATRIIRIPVPTALSFLPFPLSLSPPIVRPCSLRRPSLGPLSPSPSLCVALNPFPLRLPLRAASPRYYCPSARSPPRPIDPVHPRANRVRIEARIVILARWWRVAVGRVGGKNCARESRGGV